MGEIVAGSLARPHSILGITYFHSLSLESAFPHLQLRGVTSSVLFSAGGAGGLPRLRWPSGLREVVKTVGLSPVGDLGPSRSRLGFSVAASRQRR
jgi:hypothetical protein